MLLRALSESTDMNYLAFKYRLSTLFATQSAFAQQACYALGIILSKAISLFLLPFVANKLGLVEFARLETLIALLNGATIVVCFGMVNLLYRQVGKASKTESKHEIAAELVGTSLLIAACLMLSVLTLSPVLLPVVKELIELSLLELILCTLILTLEGTIGLSLAWLRMEEKAFLFLRSMLTRTILYCVLTVVGLQLGYGLTLMLSAAFIASLVQVIELLIYQFRSTGIQFRSQTTMQTLKYGWPFVISGLAMYASQGMEVVILAQHISPEQLAAYVIGVKFFLVAALCNQPYLLWWYARRMNLLSDHSKLATAGVGATLGVLFAMTTSLIVWLWADWLIRLLFAPEIQEAMDFLPWLLIAGVLKQWGALYNLGCFSHEKSHTQMYIEISTGAFCALSFPIMISMMGIKGALYTFVISQLLRLIAYWVISQHLLTVRYPFGLLTRGMFGLSLILIMAGSIQSFLLKHEYTEGFFLLIPTIAPIIASLACALWLFKLGKPHAQNL